MHGFVSFELSILEWLVEKNRRDEFLDEQCRKWDPCRLNDLAYGLEGAGLAIDLRGN